MRRYLKGDDGTAQSAALRIAGSQDIYDVRGRENASVNFITCHDGFTLYDLYAYNNKHNELNGWNNTDGSNDNYSWNCGAEGEVQDPAINSLRRRMTRNAAALLLCSRGTPMFLAGDEFLNTQFGNNNAYCQDNITSWLDWGMLEKNRGHFEFFRTLIAFRKAHRCLRRNLSNGYQDLPDISFHGVNPWKGTFEHCDHYIGVMFAGQEKGKDPDIVYIASNAFWRELRVQLPALPAGLAWTAELDTWDEAQSPEPIEGVSISIRPRTVMVFTTRPVPIPEPEDAPAGEMADGSPASTAQT